MAGLEDYLEPKEGAASVEAPSPLEQHLEPKAAPASEPQATMGSAQTPTGSPASTGLFLSEDEQGNIGPGILIKPLVAGWELMKHGYSPQALQPVSSEEQMPDIQGIKLAAQAAPGVMSGTRFASASPQAIRRAVLAEEANTAALGPNTAVPNAGLRPEWMAKYGSENARQAVVAAGEQEGVSVPRFIASDSKLPGRLAGGVGGIPIVGDAIPNASTGMAEKMGERAAVLARGASSEPAVPGAAAKAGLSDWASGAAGGFRSEMNAAYSPLDKIIKPETEVPLSNLAKAAKQLTRLDQISASEDGKRVLALVDEALARGKLTWEGLKELRTRVGERVHGDIAPEAGTSARALDKLYGALTEDLKFGVGQAGKGVRGGGVVRAQAAFDAANQRANELFGIRKQLTEIIGREGDNSPNDVFHRIAALASGSARGDAELLTRAKAAMGSAWDRVSESVIARMGQDEKTGRFSPDRFLTDYNKKLSEDGRKALFGDETRKHLDNMATLAQAWSDAQKSNNFSNTGRVVAALSAIHGAFTSPFILMGDVVTGYGLAKILSSPAGARAADAFVTTYTNASANPAERKAYEAAARNFANIVNRVNAFESIDAPNKREDGKLERQTTAPSHSNSMGAGRFAAREVAPTNSMAATGGSTNSEGATATNPETGARVRLERGRWVSVSP